LRVYDFTFWPEKGIQGRKVATRSGPHPRPCGSEGKDAKADGGVYPLADRDGKAFESDPYEKPK